jgi:hypothetical protein
MEEINDSQNNNLKTTEEERAYWEKRGPLAKGAKGRINPPVAKEKRSSFLSVRLSGKELTQLRDLAQKYNLGPSTFAQQVLVALVEKAETKKSKSDKKETKTMRFDDLFDEMMNNSNQTSRQQIVHSLLLSTKGEPNDASSIVMDKSKMRDWMEINIRLMSLMSETAIQDIKDTASFACVSEQEKSNQYKA